MHRRGRSHHLGGAAASSPAFGQLRWKLSKFSLLPAVLGLSGLAIFLYPSAATWVSAYNSAHAIEEYVSNVSDVDPTPAEQLALALALALAQMYNQQHSSGAIVEAHTNVARSTSPADITGLEYSDMLNSTEQGLMGRVLIPGIGVDLPIYHGTDSETLRRGAGHLRGTSLPVGGESTHSVVTAHRGLPEASLFNDLDQLAVGDIFSYDIMGEIFSYRVISTQVVQPEETELIRLTPGQDLSTLVTCTPIGLNTHRILVTGERVIPTPVSELEHAAPLPSPGFPWWAAWGTAGLIAVGTYVWWAGRPQPSASRPILIPDLKQSRDN